MKRLLFALLIAVTFISCEGPMGPEGPPGPEGLPGEGANWKIIEYTVPQQDWRLMGESEKPNYNELGTYYMHEVKDVPSLTSDVVNNGAVIAYYYNDSFRTWNPLPYSIPSYIIIDNDNAALFTESYSFDYAVGSMAFYFTVSDFYTGDIYPPRDVLFKIVMIW